ncbi:MAG: RNA 2',3'-cyclic phosphodiesterase [Candidatus Acidiferrales bacterium]
MALDLSQAIRDALREPMAKLQPLAKNARWTRPEGMHVTLKFIGNVDAGKLDAIRAALATVRSDAPVEMRVRGMGFFPDERRPRVLWSGIEASANLAPLAADTERTLEPVGIPREERKFTPHLTLARLKDSQRLGELVHAVADMKSRDFGSTHETEFHLFESVTKPSGAEYRKIESYPFVKGAA